MATSDDVVAYGRQSRRTQSASSMYYVYILMCKDGRTYVGCTDSLKNRIERHKKGYIPATARRLPVQLITYIAFKNKYKAVDFERYLKSGSGRAFLGRHLI